MAQTTIVPFANLPPCAAKCGPLYDVNGGCVPPAAPAADLATYSSCFCADPRLAPFATSTSGVCDAACAASPADYAPITDWYKNLCGKAVPTATATAGSGLSTGSPSSRPKTGGGGSWLDGHWRWVVFIVVMVVGITGIWIAAALWRRSYLRKKDRQYALGKNLARRTGSGQNPYSGGLGSTPQRSQGSVQAASQHGAAPGYESNVYGSEKTSNKIRKWLPGTR